MYETPALCMVSEVVVDLLHTLALTEPTELFVRSFDAVGIAIALNRCKSKAICLQASFGTVADEEATLGMPAAAVLGQVSQLCQSMLQRTISTVM